MRNPTFITFQALGKKIEIEFYWNHTAQNLIVSFDGHEIGWQYGDIINYPREIQAGIIRGAAADSWEKARLKKIAEEILSDHISSAALRLTGESNNG